MSLPSDRQAAIDVDDVSHRYGRRAEVLALGPISLRVDQGEFVAVVGASGCGKSTLLRLIAGFETPTQGSVLVDGAAPAAGRCGVVFQQPRLLPWRTAGGNIDLALDYGQVSRERRPERRAALLARVGLEGLEKRRTWELSGGQQQRLALARALAVPRDVLLFDEPFAALDALTRESLQEDLRALGSGTTSIFVTHSVDEAVFLASRVVVLTARPGRIALDQQVRIPREGLEPEAIRLLPEFAEHRAEIGRVVRQVAAA